MLDYDGKEQKTTLRLRCFPDRELVLTNSMLDYDGKKQRTN